jgi:hypothetical protein
MTQDLKARLAGKLKAPCGCDSGRTYQSCCLTRESLSLAILILFVAVLFYGASFDRSVALLILGAAVLAAVVLFAARARQ